MQGINTLLRQLSKLYKLQPSGFDQLLNQLAKIFDTYSLNIDAFSDSQIQSKQWISEQVGDINLGTIFLCGGWYATLLLDENLKYRRCISFDIDPTCKDISSILHRKLLIDNWKFLAVTKNIHEINYEMESVLFLRADGSEVLLTETPDTIINTSCEHIDNFSNWWDLIPKGKLVIVQSNDGFGIDGHTNCCSSLDDFAKDTPMTKLIYDGARKMQKFTRFMRVGYK